MVNTNTNQFLDYLRYQKKYSKHTLLAYQTDLEQFQSFINSSFKINNLAKVNTEQIRSWIVELKDSGINSRSINRKISSLKSWYAWLRKEGQITSLPTATIKVLKTPKVLPKYVDESEMNRLFDHLEFSDDYNEALGAAIISLLYHAGIRKAELIGLKQKDINYHQKTIKVLGKRNKERIVPIGQEAINYLDHYQNVKDKLGYSSEHYFLTTKGKPLYPKFVYNIVNKSLTAFSKVDQKSPHVLRHSFATHLLRNGAELNAIKELLGHSSLAATQVYTHNNIEHLKDIHQLHPKS